MGSRVFAALAVTAALAVGLVVPAAGAGAGPRRPIRATDPGTLAALCQALGAKPALEKLDINLSPLLRIRLARLCE